MSVTSVPIQTSEEFYTRLIDALTAGATSVAITSEAFYLMVYEITTRAEEPAQAVTDVLALIEELGFKDTLCGVPFTELHTEEDDGVSALVTTREAQFLLTLPKELAPEISITLDKEANRLEIETPDTDNEFGVCDNCEGDCNNCPEEEDDGRLELEEAVENARDNLSYAEETLADAEDEVETARDELLQAKQALEDFNQE